MATSTVDAGRREVDEEESIEPTSRAMRWVIACLLLGVMYARFPQTQAMLEDELSRRATDVSPELVGLAISVALLITFLSLPLVVAIYLSLARLLEAKLCPSVLAHVPRFPWMRVGLFVSVVFIAMFPPQLWALSTGGLPSVPVRMSIAVVVSLVLSVMVLKRSSEISIKKIFITCASSVIISILVTAV